MPNTHPILFVLRYYPTHDDHAIGREGSIWGIYSTEDAAKTEAQRYNKKVPLVWEKMMTGDRRCLKMLVADLTTWHSKCTVEIVAFRLDSKVFRP